MTAVSDYILLCLKFLASVCARIQPKQRKTVRTCQEVLVIHDGQRRLVHRRMQREELK